MKKINSLNLSGNFHRKSKALVVVKIISSFLLFFAFLSGCVQNSKVSSGEQIFSYLLTLTLTPVKIAGRAMSSGPIKDAKVEVRTPGDFSECSSSKGTLLGSGTTNSRGGYSVSIKRQGCPVCVIISPAANSKMYDPKKKKDIAWSGNVSISGLMTEPLPGKKVKRKNITPHTRVASKRANARSRTSAALMALKLGILNYDFSYHPEINKAVTVSSNGVNFSCNTDPKGVNQSNKEVAQVFFKGDDSIDDIMELDVDFEEDDSEDSKKYRLQLKAFSQLALDTADDEEAGADADDFEQIFEAMADDFSDGGFDGVGYADDGLTFEDVGDISSGSGNLDVADNFLSTTFKSAMQEYASEDSDNEFSSDILNDSNFCDDYSETACADSVDGTDTNDPEVPEGSLVGMNHIGSDFLENIRFPNALSAIVNLRFWESFFSWLKFMSTDNFSST